MSIEIKTGTDAVGKERAGDRGIHAVPQHQQAEASMTQNAMLNCDVQSLMQACRTLAELQGIRFRTPQVSSTDPCRTLSLADLCAAQGIRCRKITLRDDWWRQDNGPLLAFQASANSDLTQAVVLLPGRSYYRLLDAATSTSQKVDAGLAAALQSEAFVLYRPLPERPLKLIDLLRASLHGQSGDLRTLFGITIFSGLLALLTPVITRRIVDSAIPHSDHVELLHMALGLGISALAASLFELARGFALLRFKSKLNISLQAALWDRLLSLPVSFFRRFTVGDLASRSMGIDQLQLLLTADVTTALFSLLGAVFSLAILFYYSRTLALAVLLLTILLAAFTVVVSRRQLRFLRRLQHINGKLSGLVYSFLGGIAKLRVAGAERRAFSLWAEQFAEQRRNSTAIQRHTNWQSLMGIVYASGTTIAIFAMLGISANLGLGIGAYLGFNAAFAQFQVAALAVIGVIPTFLNFVPAYERMQPILETMPEHQAGQADVGALRGEIELRNVCFRYEDGPLVLENVSLRAAPGEFVAIVGPSGSGKSTSLRLMLGFEQPQSGSVLIDGKPVETLNMFLVRREIGVVLQNGRPMVGDIFRNIVGSQPLTMDDAWRAASDVGLDAEIRAMPMGMFTHINQRGVSFSGGQRQRLMLARAIVRRPRILLLDEATSALDNRTQDLVTRNLAGFGATRIVIAHRLSTIQHADRIYVLDSGKIVEQGTFEELLRHGGVFARMAERQLVAVNATT